MNSLCGVTLSVVRRRDLQQCSNNISVFIFVRHVFMSSLFIKPIVQHHRSRVSPVQLRDFPFHLWGNLTVKDPSQQNTIDSHVCKDMLIPPFLPNDPKEKVHQQACHPPQTSQVIHPNSVNRFAQLRLGRGSVAAPKVHRNSRYRQPNVVVVFVVLFTLTDRASTIPSNIRGC